MKFFILFVKRLQTWISEIFPTTFHFTVQSTINPATSKTVAPELGSADTGDYSSMQNDMVFHPTTEVSHGLSVDHEAENKTNGITSGKWSLHKNQKPWIAIFITRALEYRPT